MIQPPELLRAAWDERGVVETTMAFEKVNQTTLVQLKEMDGKFKAQAMHKYCYLYHMTGKSAYAHKKAAPVVGPCCTGNKTISIAL